MPPDRPRLSSNEIRQYRQAADTLMAVADSERISLIQERGLESYLRDQLGTAVHHPARCCELVWPDGSEVTSDTHLSLGEYLISLGETRLPRAVVINGEKLEL